MYAFYTDGPNMAKLINLSTEDTVTLLIQHIFGRHPDTSHTILSQPDTSRMHASIFWDGEHWLLQDSSSNGTFINDRQVARSVKHPLSKGDKIKFASLNAEAWEFIDDSAPKSLLIPITPGLNAIELETLAVLPSEDNPEITLYMSPNGHWICESKAGISMLKSGDLVGNHDKTWRFIEAKASEATINVDSDEVTISKQIGIYFDVSQNEEHVSLKFNLDGEEFDLSERNHHYLLLLLARKRISDMKNGIAPSEQGWIDKEALSQMLGQSESHINIQIYRFRKQIINTLPSSLSLPQPIERRTREIRFAYNNVVISGGANIAINQYESST